MPESIPVYCLPGFFIFTDKEFLGGLQLGRDIGISLWLPTPAKSHQKKEIKMELAPDKFKLFLPLPVTLITTVDAAGVHNGAPYGCVMPILRPLNLIAIASALPRDTLKNIRETKEFVVNVLGSPDFRKAMSCARSFPADVNEMEMAEMETTPAKTVAPLRMKNALGWIEAVLEQEVTGEDYVLTIGRVKHAEVNDLYWDGEKLLEDPLVMLAPNFRTLGGKFAGREELAEFMPGIINKPS